MNSVRRPSTRLACGHRLSANAAFPWADPRVLPHGSDLKGKLLSQLRQQADSLGLTSLELLTGRLAELQNRIMQGLGQVNFEQFQTAEPAGYLNLFLGPDLKIKVVFSRRLQSEAIYAEPVMTPGELQQQKARLFPRPKGQMLGLAGVTRAQLPGTPLADWLFLANWLRQAEDHWDGRRKEEIAREVLLTERVQNKVLSCTEMDRALVSRPAARNGPELEAIAQRMLASEDPEGDVLLTPPREDTAEVA